MKTVICQVCNRALNRYADEDGASYVHPTDVRTNHDPVPVEAPPDWRGKCDFCVSDKPVFLLPANDFRLPMMSNYQSWGSWAACEMCGLLIVTDRWADLVQRVATETARLRGIPVDAVILFSLTLLYNALRQEIRGPLRPLDEEGQR